MLDIDTRRSPVHVDGVFALKIYGVDDCLIVSRLALQNCLNRRNTKSVILIPAIGILLYILQIWTDDAVRTTMLDMGIIPRLNHLIKRYIQFSKVLQFTRIHRLFCINRFLWMFPYSW